MLQVVVQVRRAIREWIKGNGVRPVVIEMEAGARRPVGRRAPSLMALVFVRAVSLHLLQELAKERVVELVSPSSSADQQALPNEPCEVFPLEFAAEAVG